MKAWGGPGKLAAVLTALVLAAAATACTPGGSARYESPTVRSRVAASVVGTLDGRGVPVAFDRIDCHQPATSRILVCEGTTADEPTKDITAHFDPRGERSSRPGTRTPATRSCPGTLTILLDTMQFTSQELDPCR